MSDISFNANDTTYESNKSLYESINVSETDSDNDDRDDDQLNKSSICIESDVTDAIDQSNVNIVVDNKKSKSSNHHSDAAYKSNRADQSSADENTTADNSNISVESSTVGESGDESGDDSFGENITDDENSTAFDSDIAKEIDATVDESFTPNESTAVEESNEYDESVVIQYDNSAEGEDLRRDLDDSNKDTSDKSVKRKGLLDSVKREDLHASVKREDLHASVKREDLYASVKLEDLHPSVKHEHFHDSVKRKVFHDSVKREKLHESVADTFDTSDVVIQLDDSVKIEDLHDSDDSVKIYDIDSSAASSSTSRPHSVNKNAALVEKPPSIVDDVKPIHTGKTGMATFNAQQSMAVELLQNICKSLDAKPAENDFDDDPKGLKVELKPHQKHALKWMSWRERQMPRGGILADDMGLGKTLSMISLLVKQSYERDEESSDSSDSDSEFATKDKKLGWIAKRSSSKSHVGGTLVVCPATIMGQWDDEVKKFVSKNLLSVVLHHGSNRESIPRRLCKPDMVITTYGIVQSESDSNGVLFSIKWKRIILDEAHNIRNHTCKTSIACCKLRGSNRWALTGTPIQNKELDLYALLKFLRCRPFDDYSSFKMWISKTSSKSQERLNQVLQALLLRRTKEDLKNIGEMKLLPDKTTEIISVTLSTDEMNVYQKVMVYSQNLFAQFLQQRENRDNFKTVTGDEHKLFAKLHQKVSQMHGSSSDVVSGHHILILILRLRQICIHPTLIDAMLTDEDYDDGDDSDSENVPEVDLLQQLSNLKIAADAEIDMNTQDENISRASSKVLMRSNPVFETNRISSKFQKLLECILEKVIPVGEKAVVVSQFTTVLNMFGQHLKNKGIRYVMLTGETKIALRNDIKDNFNSSKTSVQIMLLSLNTGGVGLNLCGANHMFFIDPHWNPQLESQAQDRIYRMGQKKPVTIYKFLCEDTIERRIQYLQETKLQIADQILTGAKRTSSKLTIQDMKTLFEL